MYSIKRRLIVLKVFNFLKKIFKSVIIINKKGIIKIAYNVNCGNILIFDVLLIISNSSSVQLLIKK